MERVGEVFQIELLGLSVSLGQRRFQMIVLVICRKRFIRLFLVVVLKVHHVVVDIKTLVAFGLIFSGGII